MDQKLIAIFLVCLIAAGLMGLLGFGCNEDGPNPFRWRRAALNLQPKDLADAVHAVVAANRQVYAREIVQRLQDEEKLLKADSHWKEQKALPHHAQFLQLGAQAVHPRGAEFSYALRSLWPINKQHGPETPTEKAGLEAVLQDPTKPYYEELERLNGRRYFTAVYADVATLPSCVNCHNAHPDSPKKDFKVGDVMGAIVIRVALEF